MRDKVKASVFMAMRNDLLQSLRDIDWEIDRVLEKRSSKRAADRAKTLFCERDRVVDELAEFGLIIGPHKSVLDGLG